MNLTIKKLAKVTLNNAHNLPDSPGIYFACDAAYRVWYIGISSSLQDVFKHHDTSDLIINNVQYISYLTWNDLDDLEEWEHEYIQKFNPPLNNNDVDSESPIIDLGYDKSQYLARYKEIKMIQKSLEQELEELKPNLVTLIEDNDGKIKTNDCSAWYITQSLVLSFQKDSILIDVSLYWKFDAINKALILKSKHPVVVNLVELNHELLGRELLQLSNRDQISGDAVLELLKILNTFLAQNKTPSKETG